MKPSDIVKILTKKELTLGSAESYTGGGFANYITNISGASNVFKGGFVTYTNEVKHNLLGVKQKTLDKYGAISSECVKEMLQGVVNNLEVDIAVAFSGNAGPKKSENKDVGLVYIGIMYHDQVIVDCLHIQGTREEVKNKSIEYAIIKIINLIK